MITPLIALRKRAKRRHNFYDLSIPRKQKPLQRQPSKARRSAKVVSPITPSSDKAAIIETMGFVEEHEIEEVLADDELLTDSDEMSIDYNQQADGAEETTTLQPKLPFSKRANALISLRDHEFHKIENYFFSLLSTSGLSIDEILEGTFDDHEIMLITPQEGPPDVVYFQMRNAYRYRENLETKFKGHTETLAFKMACLYFGLPVEPLKTGTTPFDSSPEPNMRETNVASKPNPLQFLEEYDNENEFAHGPTSLGLRGGSGDFDIKMGDSDDGTEGLFTSSKATTPKTPFAPKGKDTSKGLNAKEKAALDYAFRNSKNTPTEAARAKDLRDRTFTEATSIFTNPLKPVMPLSGPPLESIIKTGPSMPGVSIAMMTPTEMLRLQQEVHSLRFQLLDRTRVCPYADCDRYFTFSDGAGLDQHIREEHSVLRCFFCDKNANLLPYYDTDKIKEHFITEHLGDILKIHSPPASPQDGAIKAERLSDEEEEVEDPFIPPQSGIDPDDPNTWNPELNPWQKLVDQVKAGIDPWAEQTTQIQEQSKTAIPPTTAYSLPIPPEVPPLDSPASSDVDPSEGFLPGVKSSAPKKSSKLAPPKTAELKTPPQRTGRPWTPASQTPRPNTAAPRASVPKTPLPPRTPRQKAPDSPTPLARTPASNIMTPRTPAPDTPTPAPKKSEKPTITKTTTEDGKAEIFTMVNPNPSTAEQNGAWVKGMLEQYVAEGGVGNGIDISHPTQGKANQKIFTALNKNPGTWQENAQFIREQLAQYVQDGGVLSSIAGDWANKAEQRKKQKEKEEEAGAKAKAKAKADAAKDKEKSEGKKGGKGDKGKGKSKGKGKGKRKRSDGAAALSTESDESYEYSERSAVEDGPENLVDADDTEDAATSPPSAKKVKQTPRTQTDSAPRAVPAVPGPVFGPGTVPAVPGPSGIPPLESPASSEGDEYVVD